MLMPVVKNNQIVSRTVPTSFRTIGTLFFADCFTSREIVLGNHNTSLATDVVSATQNFSLA